MKYSDDNANSELCPKSQRMQLVVARILRGHRQGYKLQWTYSQTPKLLGPRKDDRILRPVLECPDPLPREPALRIDRMASRLFQKYIILT